MMKLKKVEDILLFVTILLVFLLNSSSGYGNIISNAFVVSFIFLEFLLMFKKKRILFNIELLCLIMFFILCLVSCLYSTSYQDSLVKVRTLFIMILLIFSLNNYLGDDCLRMKYFIKSIAVCGTIASLYVLLNSGWLSGLRAGGIIGDPNQVSAYISYSSIMMFYCMKKGFINRKIALLCLLISGFSILISGSRSGVVTFIIGIFFLIFKYNFRKLTLKSFFIILLIPFLLYFVYYIVMNNEILYEIVGNRFVSFFEIITGKGSSINETSTQTRMHMLSLAWNRFTYSPFTVIFGNGIGSFASFFENNGGWFAFCHNNYLELLNGIGIFGTFFWYLPIVKAMFLSFKNKKNKYQNESNLCLALIIEMLIMHFFVVFYYEKCEFFFLAVIFFLIRYFKRNKDVI